MADTPPHGPISPDSLYREVRRLHGEIEKRVRVDLYQSERDAMREDVRNMERNIAQIKDSQLQSSRANFLNLIGILVTLIVLAVNVIVQLGT